MKHVHHRRQVGLARHDLADVLLKGCQGLAIPCTKPANGIAFSGSARNSRPLTLNDSTNQPLTVGQVSFVKNRGQPRTAAGPGFK